MSAKWALCLLECIILINIIHSITLDCRGYEQCKTDTLNCNDNEICNVICDGFGSCLDVTLNAKTATHLSIDCQQSESCKQLVINAQSVEGNVTIDCSNGYNVCSDSKLYAQQSRSVEVNCNDRQSCKAMVIECENGDCSLNCNHDSEDSVCESSILICGTQTCDLWCQYEDSCNDITINTNRNNPKRFECHDECDYHTIPDSWTSSPTNVPTIAHPLTTNEPTVVPTKQPSYSPSTTTTNAPTSTSTPTLPPTVIPTTFTTTMQPSESSKAATTSTTNQEQTVSETIATTTSTSTTKTSASGLTFTSSTSSTNEPVSTLIDAAYSMTSTVAILTEFMESINNINADRESSTNHVPHFMLISIICATFLLFLFFCMCGLFIFNKKRKSQKDQQIELKMQQRIVNEKLFNYKHESGSSLSSHCKLKSFSSFDNILDVIMDHKQSLERIKDINLQLNALKKYIIQNTDDNDDDDCCSKKSNQNESTDDDIKRRNSESVIDKIELIDDEFQTKGYHQDFNNDDDETITSDGEEDEEFNTPQDPQELNKMNKGMRFIDDDENIKELQLKASLAKYDKPIIDENDHDHETIDGIKIDLNIKEGEDDQDEILNTVQIKENVEGI